MNNNLVSFFESINDRVISSLKNNNFESLHLSLLEETFNTYQKKCSTNLFNTTIFIFYFIIKNCNKNINEQSILLGAFCTLYIISLDLFDDIQDDDLKGKLYEEIGIPIAINNAITLLFLALDFLGRAIEIEQDQNKKLRYLRIFNKASILATKGQHLDLIGCKGCETTEEILSMQKDRASSISIISNTASVFSDCDEELINKYQNISEQIMLVFQIVDDIKDIFGKKISPDLMTNKVNYPIACFLECANKEQKDKFQKLKNSLPHSIKEIRELLYTSGSIKKSAEAVETFRVNIHKELSLISNNYGIVRAMLFNIDSLANSIYKTNFIEESKKILQPNGEWYSNVEQLVNNFFYNLKDFNPPIKPIIMPWHRPEWMYEPKRNMIFYSDIEGLSDEVIPSQAQIIGISDLKKVKEIVLNQTPFVMAHEIFHYWRKASGKLTQDYWYEEWVANSLAISYIEEFLPSLFNENESLINEIIFNRKLSLNNKAIDILNRVSKHDYNPNSKLHYNVDLNEMSSIQFFMMREIYSNKSSLENNIKKFL